MKKFSIKLTKGDDVTILCVKDTKEEAMKMGEAFKKQYSRESGLLACIGGAYNCAASCKDRS